MPLGKTPILQNDLMAESDNQKHLLFNDAMLALEDSINRNLAVNLSANNVALTETQLLRFGMATCHSHTVARDLIIPISVGFPVVTTNRKFAVRNTGTASVTVKHETAGETVVVPPDSTALIYANGTDIITLGGVGASTTIQLKDDGVALVETLTSLNITGTGFTLVDDGVGAATLNLTATDTFSALSDTPATFVGNADKFLKVNTGETALEYVDAPSGGVGDPTGHPSILANTGTAYTVTTADMTADPDPVILTASNAANITITVPPSLTGVDPLTVIQIGAGQVTFVAGAGVTINSADARLKLRVQYSSATLIPSGTNNYFLIGDLTA